ncbi:MAG: hypothetical protein V3S41_04210 [Spirochaetia bacterium]
MEQLSVISALLPHLSIGDLREVLPEAWWQPPTGFVGSSDATKPAPELAAAAERFLRVGSGATTTDPAPVLAQWLRFYGPREARGPARTLCMEQPLFDELINDLSEAGMVVIGTLIQDGEETQVCDAENLEHLLAMLRRAHRPVFAPVTPQRLVGLWAETSGLETTGLTAGSSDVGRADPDQLVRVLETLFGYAAPVQLWESDFIPARLGEYYPVWLDGLFKESGLTWFGAGPERLAFALGDDLPLFLPAGPMPDSSAGIDSEDIQTTSLMAILHERMDADLWELADRLDVSSEDITKVLWTAAWKGRIANDSFETVRRGALTRFTATPVSTDGPTASS